MREMMRGLGFIELFFEVVLEALIVLFFAEGYHAKKGGANKSEHPCICEFWQEDGGCSDLFA
jgi:hypothetical protein